MINLTPKEKAIVQKEFMNLLRKIRRAWRDNDAESVVHHSYELGRLATFPEEWLK